jgi:LPXTG-site transpeptidase (sortase) family protein
MSAVVPDGEPFPAPPAPTRPGRPRPLRWLWARMPEARIDRALVIATLTAVIVVGGSTVAIVRHAPSVARASVDAPTLDPVATTTTLPPTSTSVATAPAPRTIPIAPPENPHAAVPVVKIGEIQIPRIGLVHPIYEGVTLTVIDNGPGHWPGSAVPGQLGNAVFAGHRVTHTHPFLRINELVEGDEIIFKMAGGTFTYRVTGHQVVTPRDVHIVDPTPDATLTLFACHPPHQAIQRYVVRGVFVSSTPA